jgi:ribonuclease HI
VVKKMNHANLYTDGGARGNPGPAGIGIVLVDDQGKQLKSVSQYIGNQTNNIAEYKALIRGLEIALDYGIRTITCYLDSELVVKQINQEYKVKNEGMLMMYRMAVPLLDSFEKYVVTYIPRSGNTAADDLANKAMNEQDCVSVTG